MPFALVVVFVAWINTWAYLAAYANRKLPWMLAHLAAALLLLGSFLWGIGTSWGLISVGMDFPNLAVPGFLVGALSACVLGVSRFAYATTRRERAKWAATVLGGLYICFAVADHAWYFRHADQMLIGSAAGLRELGKADVKCPEDLIVANLSTQPARYRCATTGLNYGPRFNAIFLPWPGYTTGESVELRDAVARMGLKVNPRPD